MTDVQLRGGGFTRRDYLALPEGYPAELVEGALVKEPAPTRWHQHVVLEIAVRLRTVVARRCVVVSPVDVFVDDRIVLQPDVLVTSPEDAVGPGAQPGGTPRLVVEVHSASTARFDRETKAGIYLRAGVREVWLVDPDAGTIEVRTPDSNRCFGAAERASSSAAVPAFDLAWSDLA